VSKLLGSRYCSGRSHEWLEMKNPEAPAVKREAEAVKPDGAGVAESASWQRTSCADSSAASAGSHFGAVLGCRKSEGLTSPQPAPNGSNEQMFAALMLG
jgi:hypothetical protein